jgi:hypothetical protein
MQLKLRQAAFKELSIAWNSLRVDYEQINQMAVSELEGIQRIVSQIDQQKQNMRAMRSYHY